MKKSTIGCLLLLGLCILIGIIIEIYESIFGLVGVTIEGNKAIYEKESGIYSSQALCDEIGVKVYDIAKEYENKITKIEIKIIDDCVDSYGNNKKYTSIIEVYDLKEICKYADAYSYNRSSNWVTKFGINYKPCGKYVWDK